MASRSRRRSPSEEESDFSEDSEKPPKAQRVAGQPAGAKTDGEKKLVLEYITRANRPYNAVDVANGMQDSGIKKAAFPKMLQQLHDEGLIRMKTYGKSAIFGPVHPDTEPEAGQGDSSAEAAVLRKRSRVKELGSALSALEATPTDRELREKIAALEKERGDLGRELGALRRTREPVDPQVKNRILAKKAQASKAEGARRQKCMEIIAKVTEGLEMTRADLVAATGIEIPRPQGKATRSRD